MRDAVDDLDAQIRDLVASGHDVIADAGLLSAFQIGALAWISEGANTS